MNSQIRATRKRTRARLRSWVVSIHNTIYPELAGKESSLWAYRPEQRTDANTWLGEKILSGEAFCAGRFGADELEIVQQWRRKNTRSLIGRFIEAFASGDPFYRVFRSRARIKKRGLKPLTVANHKRFYDLMLESMEQIALLGSWVPGEAWFAAELGHVVTSPRVSFEPYRHEKPWTLSLQGKRVLVVHPFDESIREQYQQHRDRLFPNNNVLPDFELHTLVPPRAHFGEIRDAEHWFELFHGLVESVCSKEFDVAIIGAGPFGLPLAAEVKKAGRQAIHLAGATQILFGIRGTRWNRDAEVKALFNDFWVTPKPSETPPKKARKMSESSYW